MELITLHVSEYDTSYSAETCSLSSSPLFLSPYSLLLHILCDTRSRKEQICRVSS